MELTNVAVGSGRAIGRYRIDLSETDPVLQFSGGPVLKDVELSEEICRTWLKYVSPLTANATDVRGRFSLELDPLAARLASDGSIPECSGRLLIDSATMRPGPIGRDLMGTIGRVGAVAGADRLLAQLGELEQADLVRVPNQQVAFAVRDGAVIHRGFRWESSKLTVSTEGAVGLNEQLNVLAKLNVDASAFRGKPVLANIFSRPIDVPIRGKISSPQIDASGLANFGADAAAGALDGLLQKLIKRKR